MTSQKSPIKQQRLTRFRQAGDQAKTSDVTKSSGKSVSRPVSGRPSGTLSKAVSLVGHTPNSKLRSKPSKPEPRAYHGHRERLRQRFLKDPQALQDYELLELLLCFGIPRVDVKGLAKQLLQCYHGSLWDVVNSPVERLRLAAPLRDNAIAVLKIVAAVAVRASYRRLCGQEIFSSWTALKKYCQERMAPLQQEEFHLLCLDKRHRLLSDELIHQGTVDRVYVYVSEVVKRALNVGAKHVVLVHNHPSGERRPSHADGQVTREMVKALHAVDIEVLDHLIVSRQGVTSLRDQGLVNSSLSTKSIVMSNEAGRLASDRLLDQRKKQAVDKKPPARFGPKRSSSKSQAK